MSAAALNGNATRSAWLLAYGLVTFFSFPHPIGDGVLDLGAFLSWLSPACMLLALRGQGVVRAALSGFVASWLAHAAILHWIYVVTVDYGGAPPFVGVLAPFGLALYMGLHGAIFAAGWAWLCGRGANSPWVAATLWVVVDHLRSFLLTGFPWAEIGYAQHANTMLVPIVAWTGVYGLSFVTSLGGASLVGLYTARPFSWRSARPFVGILAAIGVLHALGATIGSGSGDGAATTLRVAAIQGSVDPLEKWSPERASEVVQRYERLSREAVRQGARLVVWPETAVAGPLELEPELAERLIALARETRAAYVIGAVGVAVDREAGLITDYYDSAFVLDWQGQVVDRYDKSHLVPFGEYVPLRGLLGEWIAALARGIAPLDVSAGEGPRASVVDLGPGIGRIRVGIPICYELLFPDRVRRFVDDGAQLLVAITNDAWYGRTGAPHQFLAMTALRAAETGAWTVRAANTGVSAIIDGRGIVREQSALFEPAVLVADVPLLGLGGGSPYARWGDLFVAGCWIGLTGAALRAARARSGGPEADVETESNAPASQPVSEPE